MGYEQNGAIVALQHLLKPLDRLDIEMVRRLIEDEKIRLREEDLFKPLSRFLPSGKRVEVISIGLDLLLHCKRLRIREILRKLLLSSRHIRMLLREIADLFPLCKGNDTVRIIWLFLSQDTLNKRRLAGSIDPDNRRFLLVLDMEGHTLQNLFPNIGFI